MQKSEISLGGIFRNDDATKLFKQLGDNQGATLRKVSEMAAIPKETAQAHLDDLEDAGMVASTKVAGRKRYFTSDFLEAAVDVVDRNGSRIIENIPEDRFIRMSDLRARTGLEPWVLEKGLDELCTKGLVERKDLRRSEQGFRLKFSRGYYTENVLTLND